VLRAGQIIRRIRDFIGQGEADRRLEDVAQIIEEAAALALVGPDALGVETRYHFDASPSLVFADRVQIQQVLVNLMRNALEAMSESERRELVVTTARRDQETIEVSVADSGQGLPPEVRERLFRPFVSTSGAAWGSASLSAAGLSKHMAANCGANRTRLAVQSFASPLMLLQDTRETMPSEGIVHVVDDDPAFLRSMRALLDSAGFATCTYDSAPAVLDAASQLSGGCILLDVQMPGMNGLELQANLNELDIRLPVIVMTGQGDVATAVRAMKVGAVDFIEKPFDDDLLLTAIETALATAAGQASRERTIAEAAALIAMLSPREQQVLEGILAGCSTKMIAHGPGISPRTVEVHRAHMLERLRTRTIAEAIRPAVTAGLSSAVR
jgi:two-component system, LuxR family, response regulator FixJ